MNFKFLKKYSSGIFADNPVIWSKSLVRKWDGKVVGRRQAAGVSLVTLSLSKDEPACSSFCSGISMMIRLSERGPVYN